VEEKRSGTSGEGEILKGSGKSAAQRKKSFLGKGEKSQRGVKSTSGAGPEIGNKRETIWIRATPAKRKLSLGTKKHERGGGRGKERTQGKGFVKKKKEKTCNGI